MKRINTLPWLCALAVCACNSAVLEPENNLLSLRFTAVQEENPTKTTLGADYGILMV